MGNSAEIDTWRPFDQCSFDADGGQGSPLLHRAVGRQTLTISEPRILAKVFRCVPIEHRAPVGNSRPIRLGSPRSTLRAGRAYQ
jgi:hypothetical protein